MFIASARHGAEPGQGPVLRGHLDVATRYLQILGGIGFTWEHDAHLLGF